MSISFIASKGNLKLFSFGNYRYQICILSRGEFKTIRDMYGYDLEAAKKEFESI